MVHWVKDLVLSLQELGSLLWRGFDSCPGNIHMLGDMAKKKKIIIFLYYIYIFFFFFTIAIAGVVTTYSESDGKTLVVLKVIFAGLQVPAEKGLDVLYSLPDEAPEGNRGFGGGHEAWREC